MPDNGVGILVFRILLGMAWLVEVGLLGVGCAWPVGDDTGLLQHPAEGRGMKGKRGSRKLIPSGIWPPRGRLHPRVRGGGAKSWVPRLFVYMFIINIDISRQRET